MSAFNKHCEDPYVFRLTDPPQEVTAGAVPVQPGGDPDAALGLHFRAPPRPIQFALQRSCLRSPTDAQAGKAALPRGGGSRAEFSGDEMNMAQAGYQALTAGVPLLMTGMR